MIFVTFRQSQDSCLYVSTLNAMLSYPNCLLAVAPLLAHRHDSEKTPSVFPTMSNSSFGHEEVLCIPAIQTRHQPSINDNISYSGASVSSATTLNRLLTPLVCGQSQQRCIFKKSRYIVADFDTLVICFHFCCDCIPLHYSFKQSCSSGQHLQQMPSMCL